MGSTKMKLRAISVAVVISFLSSTNSLPIKTEFITESEDYDEVSSVRNVMKEEEVATTNTNEIIKLNNVNKLLNAGIKITDKLEISGDINHLEDEQEEYEYEASTVNEFIDTDGIEHNYGAIDQDTADPNEAEEATHTYGLEDVNEEQYNAIAAIRAIRPGQRAVSYSLFIEPNGDTFYGSLIVQVVLEPDTQNNSIIFYAEDIIIHDVHYGITTITNPFDTDYNDNDVGILEIFPPVPSLTYFFLIEYTARIRSDGTGLYRGIYDGGADSYLAMNLYPTHARRVFPCIDEPTNTAALSLTVNNVGYNALVSNALNEGNANEARFSPLSTATHLWGLVAHNLQNLQVPVENLRLYGRQGVGTAMTSYAGIMIQSIFLQLNTYTEKPYFEIDANAEEFLHIFAMPDITRDWRSLSTIGIWEPNILMNEVHAMEQQKTALVAISTALAGQWFGYVIFPENWRYSWIIKGMQIHVAYELADIADPELDMNTAFVADVIYEAMVQDAYAEVNPLEASEDLFDEQEIRNHLNGVMSNKAPAIMNMLKLALGEGDDYIRHTAVSLLNVRSLQTVNNLQFRDAVNSEWFFSDDGVVDDIEEFLEPWLQNSGYPVITVATAGVSVVVTQERFSYTTMPEVVYNVPLTFTTRFQPNFDNIYPERMLDSTGISFPINLLDPEEDWIIFNIQGQGYYRVNYEESLWEKLIWALEEPEQRQVIHPLNRAALVDDALNLARAGRLDYETAFEVVLTMEHETDYAVWKAFVRSMEFLRKRLVALDDDWDDDIYVRMVRRSIVAVERDLGFNPDPLIIEDNMASMTRGLVMEHACKALYQPCIAAAVDWFWNGNDLNTNIPSDLRPAVYCTMVREGGDDIRELLWERYEIENSMWEKVVILKAMTCSQDQGFILSLLQETITDTTIYGTEERSIIFKGVIESSTENTDLAFRFLQSNINAMLNWYGGIEKIEEILVVLSENLPDHDQTNNFVNWAFNYEMGDEAYAETARRVAAHAQENLLWIDMYLEEVYDWINDNDATSLSVSMVLIFFGLVAAIFNR